MTTTLQQVSPQQLQELHNRDATIELIDVRTPIEFREMHVEFARNVPLDKLDAQRFAGARDNDNGQRPLYVICQTGNRGEKACGRLAAAGCENVVNVEGGTLAWEAAGLPLTRGKKAMSLERQVRITAGFLVLLGVILGWTVSAWFYGLSAFVGAGLMFAGITDTCGMGMLLARMPWNQITSPPSGESCSR